MQLWGCDDLSQALPCVWMGCSKLRRSVHSAPLGDTHTAKDKNTRYAPSQMDTVSQQHPEEENDTRRLKCRDQTSSSKHIPLAQVAVRILAESSSQCGCVSSTLRWAASPAGSALVRSHAAAAASRPGPGSVPQGQHLPPPHRRSAAATSFPPVCTPQVEFRCTQRYLNTVSAWEVIELRRFFHWVPTTLNSAHLFFFFKMLWTRSYNPSPGQSLDLVSWTEDNEAFAAGEENCLCSFVITKITGLIQFLLALLWGLKEVVAAAAEARWWWFIPDVQSAGKTHSCPMLSAGGAGCGLSLKATEAWMELLDIAHPGTATVRLCASGICFYSTAVARETLHLQNAEFPRPALLYLFLFKGNCCKVLIDSICEYSFLLIYKPLILWVLFAYCSLETVSIYFLEAKRSSQAWPMAHLVCQLQQTSWLQSVLWT